MRFHFVLSDRSVIGMLLFQATTKKSGGINGSLLCEQNIFCCRSLMLITDWRSKSILLLIYRYISGEAPCARLHMTDRNATAGLQISVKLHQLYSLSYFEMETCHSTVANVTCQLRVYFLATSPTGLNMLDCCLSVYFRQMSVTEQRPVFR